jgi:hypothetical protein
MPDDQTTSLMLVPRHQLEMLNSRSRAERVDRISSSQDSSSAPRLSRCPTSPSQAAPRV